MSGEEGESTFHHFTSSSVPPASSSSACSRMWPVHRARTQTPAPSPGLACCGVPEMLVESLNAPCGLQQRLQDVT